MKLSSEKETRSSIKEKDETIRGKDKTIREGEETIRGKEEVIFKLEKDVLYWQERSKKAETLSLNRDRCFTMLMSNILDATQSQAGLCLPGIQTNAVSEESRIWKNKTVSQTQKTEEDRHELPNPKDEHQTGSKNGMSLTTERTTVHKEIQDAVEDMRVTQSWRMTDIGQSSQDKSEINQKYLMKRETYGPSMRHQRVE